MNDIEKALERVNREIEITEDFNHSKRLIELNFALKVSKKALEKQISKKVYHFLEDDTFETKCCGTDVTNQDYNYCPNCGQLLGEIEELEVENE